MTTPSVPILTWHAMNVSGPGYSQNDHIAFREDLELLHDSGLRIVPLGAIAAAVRDDRLESLRGCVGLSFDDGSDFDFHDLPHPAWGPQRAMVNILADFRARHGADAQPSLSATSFTIVSPEARAELDRTCMIGCRWWNDDWYREAELGGLLSIESHGWDHNHESLRMTATTAPRGSFEIRDAAESEIEIGRAADVLRALRGRGGDVLFAYPYGVPGEFLAEEWLPRDGERLGISAAFAASAGEPVTRGVSRWRIPRYVFGSDWKSPEELAVILRDAGAVGRTSRAVEPRNAADTAQQGSPLPAARGWRDCLRTWEVSDASVVAGDLFRRCFGHDAPSFGRHFVLVLSPEPGPEGTPEVVAYVHQTAKDDYFLCGGMCVDERAYRRFPMWLFEAVRAEGGLATIVTRDSVAMLGDCAAVFGHVGEPRARAADLRTGFVDTGREHLMVIWRRQMEADERERLIGEVVAFGPF